MQRPELCFGACACQARPASRRRGVAGTASASSRGQQLADGLAETLRAERASLLLCSAVRGAGTRNRMMVAQAVRSPSVCGTNSVYSKVEGGTTRSAEALRRHGVAGRAARAAPGLRGSLRRSSKTLLEDVPAAGQQRRLDEGAHLHRREGVLRRLSGSQCHRPILLLLVAKHEGSSTNSHLDGTLRRVGQGRARVRPARRQARHELGVSEGRLILELQPAGNSNGSSVSRQSSRQSRRHRVADGRFAFTSEWAPTTRQRRWESVWRDN